MTFLDYMLELRIEKVMQATCLSCSMLKCKAPLPLRGCLKRVAVGQVGMVDLGYEQPNVSHGPDRPPVGLYQRSAAGRKAGGSAPLTGSARGVECDFLSLENRVPMADVAADLSQVAIGLLVFPRLAR